VAFSSTEMDLTFEQRIFIVENYLLANSLYCAEKLSKQDNAEQNNISLPNQEIL
jgi:hypothetical protein